MKIALFFGSYNPIHNFHIAIANHVIEHENMDQTLLILSPQSPFKSDLPSFLNRYEMCDAAIQRYEKIRISTIERDMPTPSYTIDTLRLLSKKNGSSEFSIIMGLDNWMEIHKWKEYGCIVTNYPILVIPRFDNNLNDNQQKFDSEVADLIYNGVTIHKDTRLIKNLPMSNISSTFIREEIKNDKNVLPYIDRVVYSIIKRNNLYR